jgi:hypothetical protein
VTTLTIPRARLGTELDRVSDAALARLEACPDRRWASALTRGLVWIGEQPAFTFDGLATDTPILLVASTTQPGLVYRVGLACPCKAGQYVPCWHRAARVITVRALNVALDEARAAETPDQRRRREYRMWLATESHRSVSR